MTYKCRKARGANTIIECTACVFLGDQNMRKHRDNTINLRKADTLDSRQERMGHTKQGRDAAHVEKNARMHGHKTRANVYYS